MIPSRGDHSLPDLQPEVELLGVNFRTAPAAVREALSYDRDQARDLLSRAKARFPGSEALILSTCNRTEFYLVPHANQAMATAWLREVRELRSTAPIFHPNCGLYQARDLDAVRHLFRVASGLESAVLGDVQILAQLREACSAARAAGTFGPWLGEITSRAARLGRSVRSESSISRGAASVGSALAELLRRRYPSAPPDLALLGAGEAGANIAFHLAKRFPGKLQILSRDRSRADRVAAVSGGRSASWDELDRVLSETDVVISALKSPQPVLTTERLRQATAVRSKPLLVIDAGMPRNVEEGWSGEVWGVDDIREEREAVLAIRRSAIPAVERRIAEEIEMHTRWQQRRPLEQILRDLYRGLDRASTELAGGLGGVSNEATDELEGRIRRSLKRLLHRPVGDLRVRWDERGTVTPAPQAGTGTIGRSTCVRS